MALDVVDHLPAGRVRRVAPLGVQHPVERRVGDAAQVPRDSRAEEVVEVAVDLRVERRGGPDEILEPATVVVDDLELHADLPESSRQELELLDLFSTLTGRGGALD